MQKFVKLMGKKPMPVLRYLISLGVGIQCQKFTKHNFGWGTTPDTARKAHWFPKLPRTPEINPGGGMEGAAWLGAVYGMLPRKIWVPHCPVPNDDANCR